MTKQLIALSLLAVPLAAAAQSTTYDYTGAPLSTVVTQASSLFGSVTVTNAEGAIAILPPASAPPGTPILTTYAPIVPGNVVTDSVTLASPLAPNLVSASVTPTSFYLQINSPEPFFTGSSPDTPFNTITENSLTVSTNAEGQIIAWDISLAANEGSSGFTVTSIPGGDYITDYAADRYNSTGVTQVAISDAGGAWADVSGAEAAPEINSNGATAALTLLAGIVLVLTGKPRRYS